MLDPALIVAVIVFIALAVYTLTGGADFGGGVWDAFASGPRKSAQRALISKAIGPIWEANHVWLILVVVLLFVCFPPAFAAISTALHIPLTLMLIGVVLRGSAFIFRAYDPDGTADGDHPWGVVFAVSSIITPIMLGVVLGAVVSGDLPINPDNGLVVTDFVSAWLAPFPILVGFTNLALSSLLAAVYLVHEARGNAELQADFRKRALIAGVATGAAALSTLIAASSGAPLLWDALVASSWAMPFQLLTGTVALSGLGALMMRKDDLARVLVMVLVVAVVTGLGLGMLPWIVPPDLTFTAAASPPLRAVAGAGGLGTGQLLVGAGVCVALCALQGQCPGRDERLTGNHRIPPPLRLGLGHLFNRVSHVPVVAEGVHKLRGPLPVELVHRPHRDRRSRRFGPRHQRIAVVDMQVHRHARVAGRRLDAHLWVL